VSIFFRSRGPMPGSSSCPWRPAPLGVLSLMGGTLLFLLRADGLSFVGHWQAAGTHPITLQAPVKHVPRAASSPISRSQLRHRAIVPANIDLPPAAFSPCLPAPMATVVAALGVGMAALGMAFLAARKRPERFVTMASLTAIPSYSAQPGTQEKESQAMVTPLDSTSSVLVVGASKGLGLEFVRQLLAKGCAVVATHRGAAAPADLAQLSGTGRLRTVTLDVKDEDSIRAAAATLAGEGVTFTHLIHNAGVYEERQGFEGTTKAAMMSTFEANSVGPLLVAMHFAPLLKAAGSCKLPVIGVLTSKMGSVDDNTSGGSYSYRASKAACNIIVKSLYIDLKSAGKATVVLLHPGYVRTPMTGFNGLIDPPESVGGMLRAIEATGPDTPFRWVDFKATRIPW